MTKREIIAYPTMYERVVNQLLSTDSSQFDASRSLLAVRGASSLTGETSIGEEVDETHVVTGIDCVRLDRFLGRKDGSERRRKR